MTVHLTGDPVELGLQPILNQWDQRFAGPPAVPFDSCRVFHGRGGCWTGLEWCAVDVHYPVVVVTLFREPPGGFMAGLRDLLAPRLDNLGLSALVSQQRYHSGAPYSLLWGELPQALFARRDNLQFHLSLHQQNPGFFLDMEPGRQWLQQHCAGKRVLNLFAYTCVFSVVAQAAGAAGVVNVDMSSRSLSIGRENHRINAQSTRSIEFMAENILKSWSRIRRRGPFDVIVIDPPSFQKGSFVAKRDYAKVVRRLEELAAPDAKVLACLNAPELGAHFLQELFSEHSPRATFVERLPGHLDFPDVDAERQLKLLIYRMAGSHC